MVSFREMTKEEQVEVLMQDSRERLLKDCRAMGITAHKITDKRALCTMMVTRLRYIHKTGVKA